MVLTNFKLDNPTFWTIKLSCFCYGFLRTRCCVAGNLTSTKKAIIQFKIGSYQFLLFVYTKNSFFIIDQKLYIPTWRSLLIFFKILHSFFCECIGFFHINHCQPRENSNKRAWRNKGAGWNFYPKLINEQVPNKGEQGGQIRKK